MTVEVRDNSFDDSVDNLNGFIKVVCDYKNSSYTPCMVVGNFYGVQTDELCLGDGRLFVYLQQFLQVIFVVNLL